jgi:hypothetical protein
MRRSFSGAGYERRNGTVKARHIARHAIVRRRRRLKQP